MPSTIKKPHFFIVGAPKCGTGSMNDYLKQHPQIFMTGKDFTYFGSDLNYRKQKFSEKDYLSLFKKAKDYQIIGEKSVWHLASKTAAFEIKKFT